jgi:hypothetical protein
MRNHFIIVAMLTLLALEGCHLLNRHKKASADATDSIASTYREVSEPMLPMHTQPHPAQGVSVPRPRPHQNVTLDSLMHEIKRLDAKIEVLRKQPPPVYVQSEDTQQEDEVYRFWGMAGLFVLTIVRSYMPKLLPHIVRVTQHLPPLGDIIEWLNSRPRRRKRKEEDEQI